MLIGMDQLARLDYAAEDVDLDVPADRRDVRMPHTLPARQGLRTCTTINCRFWRGEDKTAKEGEADILPIRRCSLTLAVAAAARRNR